MTLPSIDRLNLNLFLVVHTHTKPHQSFLGLDENLQQVLPNTNTRVLNLDEVVEKTIAVWRDVVAQISSEQTQYLTLAFDNLRKIVHIVMTQTPKKLTPEILKKFISLSFSVNPHLSWTPYKILLKEPNELTADEIEEVHNYLKYERDFREVCYPIVDCYNIISARLTQTRILSNWKNIVQKEKWSDNGRTAQLLHERDISMSCYQDTMNASLNEYKIIQYFFNLEPWFNFSKVTTTDPETLTIICHLRNIYKLTKNISDKSKYEMRQKGCAFLLDLAQRAQRNDLYIVLKHLYHVSQNEHRMSTMLRELNTIKLHGTQLLSKKVLRQDDAKICTQLLKLAEKMIELLSFSLEDKEKKTDQFNVIEEVLVTHNIAAPSKAKELSGLAAQTMKILSSKLPALGALQNNTLFKVAHIKRFNDISKNFSSFDSVVTQYTKSISLRIVDFYLEKLPLRNSSDIQQIRSFLSIVTSEEMRSFIKSLQTTTDSKQIPSLKKPSKSIRKNPIVHLTTSATSASRLPEEDEVEELATEFNNLSVDTAYIAPVAIVDYTTIQLTEHSRVSRWRSSDALQIFNTKKYAHVHNATIQQKIIAEHRLPYDLMKRVIGPFGTTYVYENQKTGKTYNCHVGFGSFYFNGKTEDCIFQISENKDNVVFHSTVAPVSRDHFLEVTALKTFDSYQFHNIDDSIFEYEQAPSNTIQFREESEYTIRETPFIVEYKDTHGVVYVLYKVPTNLQQY